MCVCVFIYINIYNNINAYYRRRIACRSETILPMISITMFRPSFTFLLWIKTRVTSPVFYNFNL